MKAIALILAIVGLVSAQLAPAADSASDTLQKGLFEEEANHNLDAAIKAYQAVIARHDDQRKLAATAVFRLGECYRKLGRTNEATAQYQRILREFVDQTPLANLSRQNLTGLGTPISTMVKSVEVAGATDEEEKEVKRIKALIKDSPDLINSPDPQAMTPLHRAAGAGQLVVARFLLANQADINARGKAVNITGTPLHMAALRGHKTMTELLLSSGADINAAGTMWDNEGTPLHLAAGNNYKTVVEVLLANKANGNARSSNGRTPLHAAADGGYKPIAELLLANGADINAKDSSDQTPLHLAASKGHLPVVNLLVARGADVNTGGKNGSPVVAAVAGGHLKVAEALLDHGADVNAKSPSGDSLLHIALKKESVEMLKLILAHKPDLEIQNPQKTTPLQKAAIDGVNAELVRLLLAAGADANHNFPSGTSPLIVAAEKGLAEVVEALLIKGANVDFITSEGKTALHYSVEKQSLPMVTALLARHPDTEVRDSQGFTPLLRVVIMGESKIAEALIKGGANVDAANADGYSVLHAAVGYRRKDLVELLLTNKANVNLMNKQGDTPLAFTRRPNNPGEQATLDAIAALLLKHGADENIRRRSFISGSRAERNLNNTVFYKGTSEHNRYTLLELIAGLYAESNPDRFRTFAFPDFANVKIQRVNPKEGTGTEIKVDLEAVFKSGDCSKDVPLEWGDIVEIPELDHRADENWFGLSQEIRETLRKCLKRTVQITVKGEATKVLLVPNLAPIRLIAPATGTPPPAEESWKTQRSFRLKTVLQGANVIRVSSDLSRVKVKRFDLTTGQSREMLFDLSDKQADGSGLASGPVVRTIPSRSAREPAAGGSGVVLSGGAGRESYDERTDLWLLDGDVIEVPEK